MHAYSRIDAKLQDLKGYWYDRFESSRGENSSLDIQDLEQTFERIEKVHRDGVS